MVVHSVHGHSRPTLHRLGLPMLPNPLPAERKTARKIITESLPLLHLLLWNTVIYSDLDPFYDLLETMERQVLVIDKHSATYIDALIIKYIA